VVEVEVEVLGDGFGLGGVEGRGSIEADSWAMETVLVNFPSGPTMVSRAFPRSTRRIVSPAGIPSPAPHNPMRGAGDGVAPRHLTPNSCPKRLRESIDRNFQKPGGPGPEQALHVVLIQGPIPDQHRAKLDRRLARGGPGYGH